VTAPLRSASVVLADSDTGKGSPIGLFVLFLLVVAVYFLYRSMSRHIRKVPPSFDRAATSAEQPAASAEQLVDQPANEEQSPPQPPLAGPRP